MSRTNNRSEADIASLPSKFLSSLKRYNVSYEVLEKLSKPQLVVLNGVIGVKATSSLKVDELVKNILAFKNGKLECKKQRNLKVSEDEVENLLLQIEESAAKYNAANGIEFSPYSVSVFDDFAFDIDIFEEDFVASEDRSITGVVNKIAKRYFVQQGKYGPSAADPVLSGELTYGLKLRVGDKIDCNVKTVGKINVVSEVLSVNDDAPKRSPIDMFTHIDIEKPNVVVDFSSGKEDHLGVVLNLLTSFKLGQRLMFASSDGFDLSSALFFTRSRLEKLSNVYAINFKADRKEDERTYNLADKTEDVRFSTYNLVVAKIKKEYAGGQNVSLFIDDITALKRLFETFSPRIDGENVGAISMMQDLMLLPRQSRTQGSISLVVGINCPPDDKSLYDFLMTYVDSVVFGNTTLKNFGVYPPVDITRSGSKRGENAELISKLRKNIKKGNFLFETENSIKTLLSQEE